MQAERWINADRSERGRINKRMFAALLYNPLYSLWMHRCAAKLPNPRAPRKIVDRP